MPKYLVSLISEQTIPNILFIKEKERLGENIDYYIFLTTEKMETFNKFQHIIQAANIPEDKCEKILVVEDDIQNIESELNKKFSDISDSDKIIVNITGGTKIMSLASYKYFIEKKADIYYLTLGKNIYKRIYQSRKENYIDLKYRINLDDYLKSQGIEIVNKKTPFASYEQTYDFFDNYKSGKIPNDFIETMRLSRDKTPPQNDSIKNELKKLKLDNLPINKNLAKYISGEWFEEFVYNLIRKYENISDEFIGLGYKIKKQKADNELDVLFTFNNNIYIIECKTAMEKSKDKDVLEETIYKSNTLKKELGLTVKTIIMTLDTNLRDDKGDIKEKYSKRANLFEIKIYDRENFKTIDKIKNMLSEIFNNKIKR